MDKASASLPDRGRDAGVSVGARVVPSGPGPSDPDHIPRDRLEGRREVSGEEGPFRCEDGPPPRADEEADSSSGPPAAKRRKADPKGKRPRRREVDEEEAQKMRTLASSMSQEQLDCYEVYRQSAFPKATVKRLMQTMAGTTVAQNAVLAMSGIAKIFVGEVVEEALDVCEQWGETPPLHPKHLREAVRRLHSKGQIPSTKHKKILFF
ncbi:transcription initiation factor TFIID subunit 11-like [Hippopotamus amphibius kiboko]|uniref:transcription initiation factor TFIID subunit 11-like n=1 Tax=Hippopotamus amphibius kiboko TaxID=575201 RepID=UPI002594F5F2|nr:transcription initiation factor TFIID subunit 11-like [Hippopotamus amphibius kiboko]